MVLNTVGYQNGSNGPALNIGEFGVIDNSGRRTSNANITVTSSSNSEVVHNYSSNNGVSDPYAKASDDAMGTALLTNALPQILGQATQDGAVRIRTSCIQS